MTHFESHKSHRTGWLRAAVLGANDGLVSTASLIIGVTAAGSTFDTIVISGIAGLVAGAMSMAAGEYVSVSSQSDTEKADLLIEKKSLDDDFEGEKLELTKIYQNRGLEFDLAKKVADALMAHDALGAHARDEIGISESTRANPIQAAIYSACAFIIGAAFPLSIVWIVPTGQVIFFVALFSLIFLAFLGGISAYLGGARIIKGAVRVAFWGALAMAITAGVGNLIDIII